MINVDLFGRTTKRWRDGNPHKKGKIRDEATINPLLVLVNMESYNAILIKQGKSQSERLVILHELAVKQLRTLTSLSKHRFPQIGTGKENI